ncbi:hypothetical protein Pcinc_025830 [Petrolisthes cinctipes]|uniref:Uncharacterized protein n=1 Tax=Petrolisthes cinctipes TaxID=88211 RepID=A0AAE1KB98_PETCI|nr:hypothetical protein Pcinc_025830 [Petrolisthes cinctipes]
MSNENTAAGLEDGSETTEPTDFHSRLSEDISRAMEECFRSGERDDRSGQRVKTRSRAGDSNADGGVEGLVGDVIWSLQPVIVSAVTAAVTRAMESFVKTMKEEIRMQSQQVNDTILCDLQKQIKQQSYQLEQMEQYSRRENVRIKGIRCTEGEDVTATVIKVAEDIGVTLIQGDISVCHRIGTSSDANRPKPIIVRLARREKKIELMKNKKKLKRGIYIDKDLTKVRSKMLYEIRRDPQTTQTWKIDGRIFAMVNEGGEETKKIFDTPDDLYKLGWNETKLPGFKIAKHGPRAGRTSQNFG